MLQGFAAIANGKPLPYYVIPAEAVERKKEREITAKKREEKNKILLLKKKPVKVVPFKATGPLDSNSVAARRLAMKKGGNHNIGQSSDNDFSVSQSVENDTIFDTDFSNNAYSNDISTSSTIQKNTPIHTNNSEIFTSTSISTSTFGTSDPWDSSNEFSTITESKNKNNAIVTNLFESFNDDSYLSQPPPSYSSSTIIPIKTSNHGSSFDTGFGSSSASYSNSPPRYSPTKPTSVAADDLFEWSDAEVVSNKSLSPKITKTNSVDLTVFGTSHSNNSNSNDMGNQSFTSTPRKTSQETIPVKENDLFDFDFTSSSSQQSQSLKQSQSFSEFDFPSGNHEKNSIIDFFDTGLPPPPLSLPSPSPSSSLSPSLSSVSFDNRASGSQFVQSKPVSINSSAPPPKPMKPLPSTQSKVTRPFSTSNIPRQPSIPLPSNTVESRVVSQRLHPTYEVDLFDTTPGPPEIDFLSLENPDSFSSKPSLVFARQQATDVLALFDGGPTDRTNLSTSPRPTFPDLTKGQGLGQGQGLGYSQRSQQQQQQYQQQQQQYQQQQQQRGFGVGIGLG